MALLAQVSSFTLHWRVNMDKAKLFGAWRLVLLSASILALPFVFEGCASYNVAGAYLDAAEVGSTAPTTIANRTTTNLPINNKVAGTAFSLDFLAGMYKDDGSTIVYSIDGGFLVGVHWAAGDANFDIVDTSVAGCTTACTAAGSNTNTPGNVATGSVGDACQIAGVTVGTPTTHAYGGGVGSSGSAYYNWPESVHGRKTYATIVIPKAVTTGRIRIYGKACNGGSCSTATTCSTDSFSVTSPHHYEVTTVSTMSNVNSAVTINIKACADGASPCTAYTSGVSGGSVSFSGLTSNPSTQSFTMASGAATASVSVTPTVAGSMTITGTSTLSQPSVSTYCGIGVTAASGNSCALTIGSPHHYEATTSSSVVASGTAPTFQVKACADSASPCTAYTGGATGTVNITGTNFTTVSPTFSIAAGSSTATLGSVTFTDTATAPTTATLALTASSPATSPTALKLWCGMGGATPTSLTTCGITVQKLDHFEVTTSSSVVAASNSGGANPTFTITACADASVPCATPFTGGASGTMAITGANFTTVNPTFTIAAGSSSATLSSVAFTTTTPPSTTATVAISSTSPTAANATPLLCGIGAASPTTGQCTISVQNLQHIQVTNNASSVMTGTSPSFTVTLCADNAATATCVPYTAGAVSGTLSISGTNFTTVNPTFSIAAGSSTATITPSFAATAGTTVSFGATPTSTPTATGTNKLWCGLGGAWSYAPVAPNASSCTLTVAALHHLEVTTASSSVVSGSTATYTVKACTDGASPCTAYTGGVTGTLGLTGTSFTTVNPAFTIASGSSTTTVSPTFTSTTSTSATMALSSSTPTSVSAPALWCGVGGATPTNATTCAMPVQKLDHLEVTTAAASSWTDNAVIYTVKACGNSDCSITYTNGVTGNLVISGVTATPATTQAFTIASGSSTTTVTYTFTSQGTATVSTSGVSPAPGNATPLYCGIGITATSGGSCAFASNGLHHLEVTAGSASSAMNASQTYTISACANALCTTPYSLGVTGTFTIAGVTVTPSASQAFTIANGSATTTVSVTYTTAGVATASVSSVTPTPSGAPATYCGMGVAALSANSCDVSVSTILHHVEVSTVASSAVAGNDVTFTIKACATSDCSILDTVGLTGSLSLSGTGLTPSYTGGAGFTIAGGSSSTTKVASVTPSGSATVALTGLSRAPSGAPQVYCGLGVAATGVSSCVLTINPALHHLEVTTASATATAGSNVTFTVKACVDASCATNYTLGATGTLAIAGVTPTYAAGSGFTIAAAAYTTTLAASMTSGTAAISITSPSPTPTNTPAVYCGFGVAAGSGNSCNLTVNPALHHLEVTANSTAVAGNNVTFTVKACVDVGCGTLYTYGVTGTLAVSGVTPTFQAGSGAFTIGSGASTTTVVASMSPAGTATISITSPSPTPTNTPALFCGMGVAAASGNACTITITPALHHLAVTTSAANSLTCSNPVTFTITACGDSTCATPFTTGVTGNLSLTGVTANYTPAFSIGSGSSSTTVTAYLTTVGTAAVAVSGPSPTPTATPAVYCGLGAAANSTNTCNFPIAAAGFLFNVPDHLSDAAQTVSVSAVRTSDSATACTPAFASVSKSVTFTCAYSNPTTGTKAVQVGGSALNASNSASAACDGGGRAVSLSFNASGVASTTFQYADVGSVSVAAAYAGSGSDAGLSMTGSDSFIASPASFAISGVTAGPISAGSSFAATVTAKNSSGAATPNFGKETTPETVRLTWAKAFPTFALSSSGTLTGTGVAPAAALTGFAGGAATSSNLAWSEVGYGDLTATLTSGSYLGSGTTVTGTTGTGGAVGRFIPHHFDTTVTQGCNSFTYSGQPFTMTITARNASGGTTVNYNGTGLGAASVKGYAQAVTLSATGAYSGTGSMSASAVAATDFGLGVAGGVGAPTVVGGAFTFTSKLTPSAPVAAPGVTVSVRAIDADSVSSASGTEGSITVRSGRIKMSNAFGSEGSVLSIPVQAQYWNGRAWILNSADSCTIIPAASVARGNYLDSKGAAGAWTTTASTITMSGGTGFLTLSAPSPSGSTGSVDFAFNLGAAAADQSCLSTHPASTGASMSWLRSQNGNCAATYDRDPSARATFGVYAPETKKAVYVRDLY